MSLCCLSKPKKNSHQIHAAPEELSSGGGGGAPPKAAPPVTAASSLFDELGPQLDLEQVRKACATLRARAPQVGKPDGGALNDVMAARQYLEAQRSSLLGLARAGFGHAEQTGENVVLARDALGDAIHAVRVLAREPKRGFVCACLVAQSALALQLAVAKLEQGAKASEAKAGGGLATVRAAWREEITSTRRECRRSVRLKSAGVPLNSLNYPLALLDMGNAALSRWEWCGGEGGVVAALRRRPSSSPFVVVRGRHPSSSSSVVRRPWSSSVVVVVRRSSSVVRRPPTVCSLSPSRPLMAP